MNITTAELKRKLYIYSIFTDFKFFDVNKVNTGDWVSDIYLSIVKGFIEIESRDEEVKIMFEWKAIGGSGAGTETYEDAFDFYIDVYDCENKL